MNIATALKSEIARVARKALKADTASMKKAMTQYRSDIAALKRRIAELERVVKTVAKPSRKIAIPIDVSAAPTRLTFKPSTLQTHRKRLGLSTKQFGALIGVSDQSIYKWEQGASTPRASQLPAIRAVQKMGKREAAAALLAQGMGA